MTHLASETPSNEAQAHEQRLTRERVLRQNFHLEILQESLEPSRDLLKKICESWLKACEADAAILWLYNRNPGGGESGQPHFEPTSYALSSSSAITEDQIQRIMNDELTTRSLAAYVVMRGLPEYVPDIASWKDTYGGETFRMQMTERLIEAGVRSLTCIPLLRRPFRPPPAEKAEITEHIDGVISIHYHDERVAPDFVRCGVGKPERQAMQGETGAFNRMGFRSLEIMSRCTSDVLNQSRKHELLNTARRLTALTESHLTQYQRDPRRLRRQFLDEVINLIKGQLHANAVSIFCRVPLEDRLVCVATTGLLVRKPDGGFEQLGNLADVSYRPDDRSSAGDLWPTVEVWNTGKPWHGPIKGQDCKYIEYETTMKPIKGKIALHPITIKKGSTSPNAHEAGQASEVLGVVRVGSRRVPGADSNAHPGMFDVVEMGTLQFIIDQVAPVLHALENRIQREDVISIVRHDLQAPIGAIRNAVDDISDDFVGRVPQHTDYALSNLRESALRLRGLADDLKTDVSDVVRVEPKRTHLESDIVAPMKRMLYHYAAETSKMSIRYEGLGQIPPLNIDQGLIERALYNLIVNAIKYGEEQSEILVTGRVLPEEKGYAIDVQNEGPGVEESAVPRLFTRYYRSPMARGRRLGVGLGLEITRRIMKAHQGDCVLVHSRRPTIFRLIFSLSRRA